MDTMTLTLNHASVPAVLYGSPSPQVWLCLHGKGGRKEEAESFAQVVCPKGWQVLAIDLPGHGARSGGPELFTPWHAVPELRDLLSLSGQKWNRLALRAVSLGAWFSLLAFQDRPLDRALFVSPVLDMERLIQEMMSWAGVTESRLEAEWEISTEFGETLSWPYLQYVRAHPVSRWETPTRILWAQKDHLVPRDTVDRFARRFRCSLTAAEGMEHWFHTPEQSNIDSIIVHHVIFPPFRRKISNLYRILSSSCCVLRHSNGVKSGVR